LGLVQILPIESIKPSSRNGRVYKPSDIRDLAKDIKENGQLEPIVVTTDNYILSGHRRHAACRSLKLKTVKCRVHPIASTDPNFMSVLVSYNNQRIKAVDELLAEAVVKANPKETYRTLVEDRMKQARAATDDVDLIELRDYKARPKISKAKWPLLDAVCAVIDGLKDYWPLTIRQIHYKLLNEPPLTHASKPDSVYRNDEASYKKCCDICMRGRLEGVISWNAIHDPTRPVVWQWGYPNVKPFIKKEVDGFLKGYYRDLMQSQLNHIVIVGEKSTITSLIHPIASEYCVPYIIGRGYCSGSPRKQLVDQYYRSGKHGLILLILDDFDPDGEEIAHSFARSIRDDFHIRAVRGVRVALTEKQVQELDLPPAMEAKESSSNYNRFAAKYGDEAHELESVDPGDLQDILRDAIESVIDIDRFNEEVDREQEEAVKLAAIRQQVYHYLEGIIESEGTDSDNAEKA
jgi:hypothetical protein